MRSARAAEHRQGDRRRRLTRRLPSGSSPRRSASGTAPGSTAGMTPSERSGSASSPASEAAGSRCGTQETGEGFEIGRVLVWEPGTRFVVSYRNVHLPPGTSRVEVRFDPVAGGTRVRLEHSGLGELSERFRENAWLNFIGWFPGLRGGEDARSRCVWVEAEHDRPCQPPEQTKPSTSQLSTAKRSVGSPASRTARRRGTAGRPRRPRRSDDREAERVRRRREQLVVLAEAEVVELTRERHGVEVDHDAAARATGEMTGVHREPVRDDRASRGRRRRAEGPRLVRKGGRT